MIKEIQKYLELYYKEKGIAGIYYVINEIYYTERFVEWLIEHLKK